MDTDEPEYDQAGIESKSNEYSGVEVAAEARRMRRRRGRAESGRRGGMRKRERAPTSIATATADVDQSVPQISAHASPRIKPINSLPLFM